MQMFECEDVVFYELASPDKTFIARVFERDCGATTPTSKQVSIRLTSDRYDSKKPSVLVFRGEVLPRVEWNGPGALKITIPLGHKIEVLAMAERWSGVQVVYSNLDEVRLVKPR